MTHARRFRKHVSALTARPAGHAAHLWQKEQNMTDKQAIWTTAQATMMAFSPFYQVAMVDAIQPSGAAADWFTVKQALAASPFTIDNYHQLEALTAKPEAA